MLKNYLKTALRNLALRKGNSIVNIAGLTVGFAAFLLIFLVIQYEKSFDDFHANKANLYRVIRVGKHPTDRDYRTGVPIPVTNTLRTDFPQLANAGAIDADGNVQVFVPTENNAAPKKFREASGVFFAEPQFFQMFNFPLAAGSIPDALKAPNTVLLTKELANKYFGDWKTAMGKTVIMDGVSLKVTGILENPPANTDFPLKAVQSYETMRQLADFNNWGNIDDQNYCFVELTANYQPGRFQPLLDRFEDKYIKPVDPHYDLALQPLNEMHYDSRLGVFTGRTFSKDLIFALSLIGLFLLIVACVNFINLTTAQAITRAKEVGVRKVLGGRRSQLILQFLGETGITSLLALVAAVAVVLACIHAVNNLLDIHLSFSVLYTNRWLGWMFCILVGVTFLSGFYPAMVLSGFTPVTVLKGAIGGSQGKGISFRRALVVFQFVIAQALIIATLTVASQMDYFRTADMGFSKEAIINAGFPNDSLGLTKMDALRHDLLLMPGVQQVSFSSGTPATGGGYFTDLQTAANHTKDRDMVVNVKQADTGFFRLYHLPLVAGRVYSPWDTVHEYVVNETLVRNLRIPHARDAIGQIIKVSGRAGQIVGVVKDFHVNSLRDPIDPVVMRSRKRAYGLANISIDLGEAKPVLASMSNIWNRYFPDFIFEYSFLDQDIAAFYQQENQLSILYKLFSGIAIFISCLGLYGLISFMAVQRNKEIGIRKMLGAPVRDILYLLSKEFTILIAIAFLIATPIAWYFMHEWLQQYTYRISIGLWFFVATIVGSLAIAWLTVGYTAIKAALANPVKSLRSAALIFLLLLPALPAFAQFSASVKKFIAVQADTLALIHAKITDGSGSPSRPDQTLVIMKGIITAMGNSANIKVPVNAKIIDCTGKTIIPGMIMMHEHLFYAETAGDYYLGQEMPISFPQLYLAGGVTTMRTAGSLEPQTDLNLKQWIKQGEIAGPDMDVTGPYIERAGFPVPEMLHIRSPEEAAGIVNYWAAFGCTSFKVYRDITVADLVAVVRAAHQRGLKVTGHLCSVTYKEAAEAGIDNLEHGFMESSDFDTSKKENSCSENLFNSLKALDVNSKAMEQLMRLLIDKKVALTSTLAVFEPFTGREAIPGGAADALAPQVRAVVEKVCRDALNHDPGRVSLFKKEMLWEKKFVMMGGTLMAGTDPTGDGRVIAGYADRHTLELLTEAGFSFPEAVKICSLNAAVFLGIAKETGTVEIGKKADLVLIGGDPETNIAAVRNTEIVFKNGVGFDSKRLFESLSGTVGRY